MNRKLIYLTCLTLFLSSALRVNAASIHEDIDGMVVIEAENFTGEDGRTDPMGYH